MVRSVEWDGTDFGPVSARVEKLIEYTIERRGCLDNSTFESGPITTIREASVETSPDLAVATEVHQIDSHRSKRRRRLLSGGIPEMAYRRPWPFHNCQHLTQKTGLLNGSGVLELTRENSLVGEWTHVDGSCEQRLSAHTTDEFRFGYGPLGVAPILPYGETPEIFPRYLPVGSPLLHDKLMQLGEIALDNMVPTLVDGHALNVFLVELFELPALFRHVLERLPKFLPGADNKLNLGRTGAELSQGYLATIFGWLPLVSDVKTILTKGVAMGDKLESYIMGSGKRKTYHYRKYLHPETFRDASWFSEASTLTWAASDPINAWMRECLWEISLDTHITREVKDLKYTATLEYQYDIPALDEFVTSLGLACDYWGIQPKFSDIWELIPFSFVVDWIFSVQPLIARFDKKWVNVNLELTRFCHSISYDSTESIEATGLNTLKWERDGENDVAGWTYPVFPLVSCDTHGYHRWVAEPLTKEGSERLTLKMPTGYQLVTSGALAERPFEKAVRKWIHARKKHARRRRKK